MVEEPLIPIKALAAQTVYERAAAGKWMMHWLAWLLFGFRGRIPRKTYWLAQAILQMPAIAGVAGYLMINGLALPRPGSPALPSLIWSLALLFPASAVAVKRFNDRGHPFWVAGIWLGLACGGVVFAAFI